MINECKQVSMVSDRDVGAVFHVMRVKRGMTQAELATKVSTDFGVEVKQSMISKIENGSQSLDIQLTSMLSAALDLSIEYVMECAATHASIDREDRTVSLKSLEADLSTRLAESESLLPVELKGASLNIYRRLQTVLVCGDLPAGSIFTAKFIAKKFGCYLGTARTAMHQLAKEGFAQRIGDDAIAKTGFSDDYLVNLISRRFSMEARAIKAIMDKKLDISPLRLLNDDMGEFTLARESQLTTFVQVDARFHQKIFLLAGNGLFESEIGTILRHIIIGLGSYRDEVRHQQIVDEHNDLINAIQNGSFAEALARLRSHLLNGAPNSLRDRIERELPADFEEMEVRDRELVH